MSGEASAEHVGDQKQLSTPGVSLEEKKERKPKRVKEGYQPYKPSRRLPVSPEKDGVPLCSGGSAKRLDTQTKPLSSSVVTPSKNREVRHASKDKQQPKYVANAKTRPTLPEDEGKKNGPNVEEKSRENRANTSTVEHVKEKETSVKEPTGNHVNKSKTGTDNAMGELSDDPIITPKSAVGSNKAGSKEPGGVHGVHHRRSDVAEKPRSVVRGRGKRKTTVKNTTDRINPVSRQAIPKSTVDTAVTGAKSDHDHVVTNDEPVTEANTAALSDTVDRYVIPPPPDAINRLVSNTVTMYIPPPPSDLDSHLASDTVIAYMPPPPPEEELDIGTSSYSTQLCTNAAAEDTALSNSRIDDDMDCENADCKLPSSALQSIPPPSDTVNDDDTEQSSSGLQPGQISSRKAIDDTRLGDEQMRVASLLERPENASTNKPTVDVSTRDNHSDAASSKDNDPAKSKKGKSHVRFADDGGNQAANKVKPDVASVRCTPLKELQGDIARSQSKLKRLLETGLTSVEAIADVMNEASIIQDLYVEVILNHQTDAFKLDAEGALWKQGFHNVICAFRGCLDIQDIPPSFLKFICSSYWTFLQNGDLFLENLVSLLQSTYDFSVTEFSLGIYKPPRCSKQVRLALRSCHLIDLNLGDIERYVADLRQDGDYSKSIDKYTEAARLAPKNAKSYNQLAVISVLRRHKLDAIYYYIRCLDATNAIQSARDRLTMIFHDIKKKALKYNQEQMSLELSKKTEIAMSLSRQNEFQMHVDNDHDRDEFWEFFIQGRRHKYMITRDGRVLSVAQGQVQAEAKSPEKRSLREINRAFVIHYLYVHCKLYTRIGLDSFLDVHSETLNELQVLVKHPAVSSLKRISLVKYMAINMFAINNLHQKQEDQSVIITNSPLDLAIVFAMEMFQHLLDGCMVGLRDDPASDVCMQFLPAIHVWLRWLSVNVTLLANSSSVGIMVFWDVLVTFLNTAKESMRNDDNKATVEVDELPLMLLSEDVLLAGMKMLTDAVTTSYSGKYGVVADETDARLRQVLRLASQLAETGRVPLHYDDASSVFSVVVPDVVTTSPTKHVIAELDDSDALPSYPDDDEDDGDDVIVEDVDIGDDCLSNAVEELKARKLQIEGQLKEQQRLLEDRKRLIDDNAMKAKVIFCNKPQYVLLDTNCFISNLDVVDFLLRSEQFGIIVPLIVVNELDGLKKGVFADGASPDRGIIPHVQECARTAVDFLEERFSSNAHPIKAVTNQGTDLNTIAFRTETFSTNRGNNDDVILECCVKYLAENQRRSTGHGDQLVVERKVVLLTDDRNLRLKAHRRNVPTIGTRIFAHMASNGSMLG